MKNTIMAATMAAGLVALSATAASAMPVAPLSGDAVTKPEQVRLVCNEWGRCWRTGPRRYHRYGYAPRRYHRYYGDYYAYGGPRYHRRYYGGPGISFRFGF